MSKTDRPSRYKNVFIHNATPKQLMQTMMRPGEYHHSDTTDFNTDDITIRKSYNNANCFHGELHALQLLEKNFINEPRIDHYPFPKVLTYETENANSKYRYSITMTYCGISAIQNARLVLARQNLKPNNLYNTVECIINNLKNNQIIYKDFKADNICINENGNVSLIDFGRYKVRMKIKCSTFYAKPDLAQLKKDLYNAVGCEFADHLIYKALRRDENGRRRWKFRCFKKNPWSILYLF